MVRALTILKTGLVLLWLLSAGAVRAQDAHCAATDRLLTYHSFLTRLDAGAANNPVLFAAMSRESAAAARAGLGGRLDGPGLALIEDFARLVETAGRLGAAGRVEEALALRDDPASLRLIAEAGTVLRSAQCDRNADGQLRDAADPTETSASRETAASPEEPLDAFRDFGMVLMALLVTVVIGTLAGLGWYIRRKLADNRRRARRYIVRVPVACRVDGIERQFQLVDISGSGVKLWHDGGLASADDQKVEIDLDGWREIVLRWVSDTHAGGTFAQPLRRGVLSAVLQKLRQKR